MDSQNNEIADDYTSDNDEFDKITHHHHRLSLICVNDVYSFDDLDSSDDTSPRGGWARAATLMKQLRQRENPTSESSGKSTDTTVLTLANGDVLGGSSLLQHCEGSVAVQVMNSIPIDVAVLGNHEFDYGDDVLIQRLKESNFVWLGSNVYHRLPPQITDSKSKLEPNPHSILACTSQNDLAHDYFPGIHGNGKIYNLTNNLKLGVFGLVTKQTPKISNPSKNVIFDEDILSVARRTARHLRGLGAHILVAVTHMSEAEDRLLAADRVAGVDLILGGHEHEPLGSMVHRDEDLENKGNHGEAFTDETGNYSEEKAGHNEGGVLVFKCGMNAYWVGKVDLEIEYTCVEKSSFQQTKVISVGTSWSMHAVTPRIVEDPTVSRIVKMCRKETDEKIMVSSFGKEIASNLNLDDVIATVGETTSQVEGSFDNSQLMVPLDTRMSSVRRRESTSGNLLADAMHWLLLSNIKPNETSTGASLPMLAMINGGFIRGDRIYKPGSQLTVRHVTKELPFPRAMAVLEIEGQYLKKALGEQLRGSSLGPTGAFPHLSSNARLKYRIPAVSDENLIEGPVFVNSLKVDGEEVSDKAKYVIAVTGFVAEGNEGCSSWLKGTRIENSAWNDVKISSVLLQYLLHQRVITPVLEGRVKCQQ